MKKLSYLFLLPAILLLLASCSDNDKNLQELVLSDDIHTMVRGEKFHFPLLGNGYYMVEAEDPSIVIAEGLSDTRIYLEALKAGITTVTVIDKESKQEKKLKVIVTPKVVCFDFYGYEVIVEGLDNDAEITRIVQEVRENTRLNVANSFHLVADKERTGYFYDGESDTFQQGNFAFISKSDGKYFSFTYIENGSKREEIYKMNDHGGAFEQLSLTFNLNWVSLRMSSSIDYPRTLSLEEELVSVYKDRYPQIRSVYNSTTTTLRYEPLPVDIFR